MADSSSQPRLAGGRRLPEQPVLLVPGCHFFTAVAPVPAGTAEKELPGLAALVLEADSPFDEEQLTRGHYAVPNAGGLVVFAALRRKFAALQEPWTKAGFVVPDFATWLPRVEPVTGIVILETTEAVTALEFAAGSTLPRRIVSRPVPAEPGGEAGVAATREQVLARIEPGGRRVRRYRLNEIPCTVKGGRYQFHWEAQDFVAERSAEAGALTAAQLWAMDLREAGFLRVKRRDFQWNRYAWGSLVGLGVAAALLLVAEFGLLGAHLLNVRRQSRIEAQTGAARQAEANSDIVSRLSGYIDRKPQPLELLGYVNDLRPASIYFTKVSVEGGLQMVIDGATNSMTEVNEFESALKRAPALASAEVKNIRVREGGGTFQLTLAFRPGFAAGTAAPAANAPSTPVARPTTPVSSPSVSPMPGMPPEAARHLPPNYSGGDPRQQRPMGYDQQGRPMGMPGSMRPLRGPGLQPPMEPPPAPAPETTEPAAAPTP